MYANMGDKNLLVSLMNVMEVRYVDTEREEQFVENVREEVFATTENIDLIAQNVVEVKLVSIRRKNVVVTFALLVQRTSVHCVNRSMLRDVHTIQPVIDVIINYILTRIFPPVLNPNNTSSMNFFLTISKRKFITIRRS